MTKSYKRFATVTATTALVASAIAPVMAAPQETAEEAYKDVPKTSSHYENIVKAKELGIMTGYDNGTFQPNKLLNRGDVTKALGKFVVAQSGMSLEDYIKENKVEDVPNFTDVPDNYVDSELVMYSKIVKEAGIFEGSNNNLMARKLIKRDQMAEVLVRAFGFEDQEGDTVIKDGQDSAYVKSIEILYENGITTQNPYSPLKSTSRAQFATFLVRSYEATVEAPVTEITSVEAVESVVDSNKEGQYATFTINEGKKADLAQLKDKGYTVEFLSSINGLFKDKTTGELDQAVLKNHVGEAPTFQVQLKKDEETISSNEGKLMVQDFTKTLNSLDSYKLVFASDEHQGETVANDIIVMGEEAQITNIIGTSKSGEEMSPNGKLTYTTSNRGVAIVSDSGLIKTVAPGEAKITVSVEGTDVKLDVPIRVSSDQRVASNVTSSVDSVGLVKNRQKEFTFKVADQFGMPSADQVSVDVVLDDKEAAASAVANVERVTVDGQPTGEYTYRVTAKETAGKGNIIIKPANEQGADKALLSIPLTVGTDDSPASRKLELADQVEDATLDLNPIKNDQSLQLVFNQYNKDGLLLGAEKGLNDGTGSNGSYQVVATNDTVKVSVDKDGVINVSANGKTGSATINVKQGDLIRGSFDVTVEDSTPEISSVTFKNTEDLTSVNPKLADLLAVNITSDDNVVFVADGSSVDVFAEGTVGETHQESDRVKLGVVDTVSVSNGLEELTFSGEGNEIVLNGLKDNTNGSFTLRLEDNKKNVYTAPFTVKIPSVQAK